MADRASRAHAATGAGGTSPRVPARAPSPGLQATAGNAAVSGLLGSRAVQRAPEDPFELLAGQGPGAGSAIGGAPSLIDEAVGAAAPFAGAVGDFARAIPGIGGLVPGGGAQAAGGFGGGMIPDAIARSFGGGAPSLIDEAVGAAAPFAGAVGDFARAIPGIGGLVPGGGAQAAGGFGGGMIPDAIARSLGGGGGAHAGGGHEHTKKAHAHHAATHAPAKHPGGHGGGGAHHPSTLESMRAKAQKMQRSAHAQHDRAQHELDESNLHSLEATGIDVASQVGSGLERFAGEIPFVNELL